MRSLAWRRYSRVIKGEKGTIATPVSKAGGLSILPPLGVPHQVQGLQLSHLAKSGHAGIIEQFAAR